MRYLTSNLFFASIVIVAVGTLAWYLLNDHRKEEKNTILAIFTDLIFYFVVTLFGINFLFHWKEIITIPYRILIFSSTVVSFATLSIVIYSGLKYGKKLWENPLKTKSVTQLLLFIGLTNHIYLYFLYGTLSSLVFITYYMALLLLISFTSLFGRMDPLLLFVVSAAVHLLLMRNQPIIYFNFTFYTVPLLIIFTAFVIVLHVQRRKNKSNQN